MRSLMADTVETITTNRQLTNMIISIIIILFAPHITGYIILKYSNVTLLSKIPPKVSLKLAGRPPVPTPIMSGSDILKYIDRLNGNDKVACNCFFNIETY